MQQVTLQSFLRASIKLPNAPLPQVGLLQLQGRQQARFREKEYFYLNLGSNMPSDAIRVLKRGLVKTIRFVHLDDMKVTGDEQVSNNLY